MLIVELKRMLWQSLNDYVYLVNLLSLTRRMWQIKK